MLAPAKQKGLPASSKVADGSAAGCGLAAAAVAGDFMQPSMSAATPNQHSRRPSAGPLRLGSTTLEALSQIGKRERSQVPLSKLRRESVEPLEGLAAELVAQVGFQ